MPMSATGNRPPRRDDGYTLVEAMVTLAVLGLVAGAVMLSAPQPAHRVRDEATRLAARLAHASDESVMTNRAVALVVTPHGYGFARLEADGWRPIEAQRTLSFRQWPDGLDVSVKDAPPDAQTTAEGRVVRFDPVGTATPGRIALVDAGVRYDVEVGGQAQIQVVRRD